MMISASRMHRYASWLDNNDAALAIVSVKDAHRRIRDSRLMPVYSVDEKVVILDLIRRRYWVSIYRAQSMMDGPYVVFLCAIAKLCREDF
jgi:hypothetical protein